MSVADGPLRKVNQILAIPYNDVHLKQGLADLDELGGPEITERTIRSTIETAIIDQMSATLAALEPTYKATSELGSAIRKTSQIHTRMMSLVDQSLVDLAPVVTEAKTLQRERGLLKQKQRTAHTFVENYVITESEETILVDKSLPIDADFYKALEKAKAIQADSQGDLAGSAEFGEQALAQTSKVLRDAYRKLLFATEQQLRVAKPDAALRKQLLTLAERPLMFRTVLSEISETRKRTISRDFTLALNEQTQSGSALDSYSSDPVRYLGNLLAWVHSAIVNEFEHLSLLIDPDLNFSDSAVTSDMFSGLFSGRDAQAVISDIVDSITGSLEPQLRQRISQIATTQTSLVVLNELISILAFYRSMLAKYHQASLIASLTNLEQMFEDQLDRRLTIERDSVKNTRLPRDLAAPDFWTSILATARNFLQQYETGISYDPAAVDEAFHTKIHRLLDPFWQTCVDIAAKQSDKFKGTVFLLNCLDDEKMLLSRFVFTRQESVAVDEKVAHYSAELAELEAATVRKESGITAAKNQTDKNMPKFYAAFDKFLPQANETSAKRLRPLVSPRVAAQVLQMALELVVRDYAELADENAPKTVAEVRLLLS